MARLLSPAEFGVEALVTVFISFFNFLSDFGIGSTVDITPMLQKRMEFTESQMPAKLFEAMAMKKLIIASEASDIGKVLGKNETGKRGFLIDYDNIDQFIETLKTSIENPKLIERMTENTRIFYLKEASVYFISEKLKSI